MDRSSTAQLVIPPVWDPCTEMTYIRTAGRGLKLSVPEDDLTPITTYACCPTLVVNSGSTTAEGTP
jgi:hypothetical protein